jgi:leader peptidase (prepilin peptidase) / N-methyltransferase
MTLYYLILFFIGASFGSFFYTLSLRCASTEKKSIRALLISSSKCPFCEKKISIVYLIPVLGFFFARARCSSCKAAISPAYLVSEVFSGTLLCALVYTQGFSPDRLCEYLALMSILAAAAADIRIMKIPDLFSALAFVFAIYPVFSSGEWVSSAYGVLVSGGFFLVIALVFPGGFGGGDIKLAAASGFLLGIELTVVAMEISLITGTLFGVSYALISKKGLRIKIPFAPFIATGIVCAYFFGRNILAVYYAF